MTNRGSFLRAVNPPSEPRLPRPAPPRPAMATPNFLRTFLQSSRTALAAASKSASPVSIVFGNESAGTPPPAPRSPLSLPPPSPLVPLTAADLDSLSSAILYACLSPERPRPIPFVLIPRADLVLRPEFTQLLGELDLSPADLICTDDAVPPPEAESKFPPSSSSPSSSSLDGFARFASAAHVRVHLVDHNCATLPVLAENVHGVVDHHADEGQYLAAAPRIVTTAGSCSSLVVNCLFGPAAADNTDPPAQLQLATLAAAALLIDTADMTQRVTPHDTAAFVRLRAVLPATWDHTDFFRRLYRAKAAIDGLALRDLLRKDYKEFCEPASPSATGGAKVGIAAVGRSLAWLSTRRDGGGDGDGNGNGNGNGSGKGLLEALNDWARERGLDVVAVMTLHGLGAEFRRELLVWARSPVGAACLSAFVACAGREGLDLQRWRDGALDGDDDGDGRQRLAWVQGNVAMSRKQVAPLLRACLREALVVGRAAQAKV